MIPFWAALLIIAGLWAGPHLFRWAVGTLAEPVEQEPPYNWAEDIGLMILWRIETEDALLRVWPTSWEDEPEQEETWLR